MSALAAVGVADVVTVALAMTVTATWSAKVRRFAVIDAAWGATLLATAVVGGIVAQFAGADDSARRWVVTAMVAVWGARLTRHLLQRVHSRDHDDPRYEEMLGGSFDQVPFRRAVLKVFVLQGVALLVVATPLAAGQATGTSDWSSVGAGVAVWAIGVFFEAVGDAQLAAYRSDPERGPVLDTGLWAWTRHPNYFGDACVWWGVWLVGGMAGGVVPALASLPGPAVMTFFLTLGSGARPTERRMRGRPGWAAYEARTPMFFPRPPRKRQRASSA